MQKFVGTKTLHQADAAVYVATCPFSREALDIAVQVGVTAGCWRRGARARHCRFRAEGQGRRSPKSQGLVAASGPVHPG
ncbi:hypothetical protein ACFW9O_07485 [Streptomyces sp. NPDC059499]|uniref:hypothetical protein n=1 Tax=Streptomyces sp. NPDC059499 TaxID=3346852 RepID=UPI0036A9D5AD